MSRRARVAPPSARLLAGASCARAHARAREQELWTLLASASGNPSGIPQKILDEKAEEMRQKKVMEEEINVSPGSVPAGQRCLSSACAAALNFQ